MRRLMLILGVLTGLAACEVEAPNELTAGDLTSEAPAPGGDDSIREDDPHLPGSCTNPVACGTTIGVDPNGQGGGSGSVEYCSGCECSATPSSCRSAAQRCWNHHEICLINSDGGCEDTLDSCLTGCGARGVTCVCPSRH